MSEQHERETWSAPECVELTTRQTLGGNNKANTEFGTCCYPGGGTGPVS